MRRRAIIGSFMILMLIVAAAPTGRSHASVRAAEAALDALFRQAFGENLRLDPAMVRKALATRSMTLLPVDENRDGAVDAFYFRDDDPRHSGEFRPIVVKAVPPRGSFPGGKLDWANAYFAADWRADGRIDRLVAHLDDDGDGDIDRQLLASPWHEYFGPLHIVLAEDVGDDNRMWYHRNYWTDVETYWWRSDFNGDEVFHFFTFDPAAGTWFQKGEGPFAFFDNDRDGFTDEIVRRDTTLGDGQASVRWSFDLDRDANSRQPHDYDLSFSAYGPLEIPESLSARTRIGRAETGAYLPWSHARAWVRKAPWKAVMLTWDEADNNIDLQSPNRFGEYWEGESFEGRLNERWEGVLNHPNSDFPQIGGPSAGPFNRRYETDRDNSGRMSLYFSPADRRLHLRGAESGSMRIDFDLDGRVDMEIRAGDRKGTGYFDFWEVDADADGTVDLSYGYLDKLARDNEVRHEDLSGDPSAWPALNLERREKAIADNLALIGIMRGILKAGEDRFEPDAAERFYRERLRGWQTEYGHGEKMFASRETERFYTDIIRLRYFHRVLRLELPADAPRAELLKLFWSGEPGQAGDWLSRHFRVPAPEPGVRAALGGNVTNRSDLKLWRHPVSVDLRTAFPDRAIGLDGVTVWETVERLEPRPQISQCDDLDGDGRADELVFLADLRPGETRSFRFELRASPEFRQRVRASSSSGEARWESGTSRFDWTMKTGIRYTGKNPGIIFGSEGRDPSPGSASGGPVLELGAPGRTAELSAVRSGPVRAILRAARAPLVVLAYAEPDITELRWTGDASIQMRMAGSAGAALRTASGATAWQTWDGDVGTSVLWSERSGLRWDAGSKTLSLANRTGSGRLWIHGYRRSGDRTPFWPGRSNWTGDLDRLGRMIDEPVSIELGPVRTGPETK